MAEGAGAAMHIDLVARQIQALHGRHRYDGERLVDFE
jgi:hypothetical protein